MRAGKGAAKHCFRVSPEAAHLIHGVGVEKNPTKLDELGRVLCNVDTMFVTGSGNVDHDVSVDFERGSLGGSHDDGHGSVGGRGVEMAELPRAKVLDFESGPDG